MADRPLTIGVVKETPPGERRVALVPDTVATLTGLGAAVAVESGAGHGARYPDSAYTDAGAEIIATEELSGCDLLLAVNRPPAETLLGLASGSAVVGLHGMAADTALLRDLATAKVTALGLDRLPRQLSRAQAMDALSSQANVAGYKAAILAAEAYDRYFPLLMTAAGVARPAKVLVLGAGVAGLQAIATARRLGAQVTGYDVRPEAREELASLGAAVLELSVSATGEGGYARALSDEERQAQQDELAEKVATFDVVITAAQTPGRRPPVLLPAAAVAELRPGAVVVDAAAGELGGNVEGSPPGGEGYESVTTEGGVTVIGAGNLPATVPRAASDAYARNAAALLKNIVSDGRLAFDLDDEIHAAITLTHDGQLRDPAAREADEAPAEEDDQ